MIRISDLDFGYSTPLFCKAALKLESGRITGLLGKNGAGKTTLLKILCGLVEPEGGQIAVLGHRPRDRAPDFLQELFFIPEHAELPSLSPQRTADLCGAFYPRFRRDSYFALLKRLEVPVDVRPSAMSFGQKRKALLAFGLATDVSLLILDEPTNGFDISSQVTLRQILVEHVAPERTILISTHHIREFETILDDVVILDSGKIVLHRSSDDIQMESGRLDLESVFMNLTTDSEEGK